ncbi:Sugar transporter STL1 [Cyphellophora attinorum]|uniref:Sugar transporter STL1 n=1 Tax=Cyphellophora attinorum TaxID=1664694 RepID=A0A0N1GYE6_9EURO|nr:Sugar transporter STL1 [Phialophora attinorum]KPI35750.1 Sugar transporter STL1 [Phialophora attinorum]
MQQDRVHTAERADFFGLRGLRLKIAMVVLTVLPSFLLFGYNNGSMGPITNLESFAKQFPRIDVVTTKGEEKSYNALILGIVVACYNLGCISGALSTIAYGNVFGRLRSIGIGLVLSLIGLAVETSSYSLGQLIVGRLLVGGSIGILSASIPVWQTECATTKHRGAFVIMEGIFISAGITFPNWISFGTFPALHGSTQWRVTMVLPAVLAICALPFLFWMPESPRWLMLKGRVNDARNVIAAIMDKPQDHENVSAEVAHIQSQLELTTGNVKSFFTRRPERPLHRALIAFAAQSMTQWNGCSAMISYTGIVFADLGFEGTQGHLLGAGFTTTFTVAAILPLFLVDRVGRRKLFLVAAFGVCVSMAVLAGTAGRSEYAPVALTFMFLYAVSYAIGFLGLPFLYASEIAPIRLRVPISAISVTGQWLGQFVVGQITPPGLTNLGSRYWIIWAVFNASFIPIIYFFFPETNGRSLEDIDELFESSGTLNVVSNARKWNSSWQAEDVQSANQHKGSSMTEIEEA